MTSNMKSRQAAYLKHRTNAWCRIDMLLALYDAGIKNVEAAMAAAEVNDQEQLQMHRQKATRIILQLQAGLDLSMGDVPARVAQLCEYMQHVLLTQETAAYESVCEVLKTLRDAFAEIREEAIQLEHDGEIPAIDSQQMVGITA